MANSDQNRRNTGRMLGLLGTVLLFSGLFAAFVITGTLKDPYVLVQLIFGVVGIALFFATNLGQLGENFSGRGVLFLTTSVVSALLLGGALVGVNYVAVKKPKTWDLTKDKVFSLSDETLNTLKGLTQEVQILAFYGPGEAERGELESRLAQYQEHTDKLKVSYLDPAKHVEEVKQYNISSTTPRVIVKMGGKESRAKEITEESLTNAINEVGRGAPKKLYFTKGHGERGLDDATERGLKQFADQLKGEGFQLEEILIAGQKELPADMSELVIAGPSTAFTEAEAKAVRDWVEQKHGKLLLMLDPGTTGPLESTLLAWGVSADNDVVLDLDSQQPQIALAQTYADHPITSPRSAAKLSITLYPLARSLSKKGAPEGWTYTSLVETGEHAWGETSPLNGSEQVQYDEGKDVKGPITVAATLTKGSGDTESRVVVVGNSSFAANGFYLAGSNRDIALNAVVWLAGEASKISIHARTRGANRLFLSAEQQHTIALFSFDLMPFALLGAGLLVWQSRKSR